MTTVLASASPRRSELLRMLRAENLVILPAQGEEAPPPGYGPGETVEALASAKASEVAARWALRPEYESGDVIIAADTIVWLDGRILGKPHSVEQGFEMLKRLSGCTHEVYTGVAVCRGEMQIVEHECSRVTFRELDEREIMAYLATGEPMDKAGAYGAQGIGALFVSAIEGDFYNVMGLPVCRLGLMLKKTGVTLL